MFVTVFTLMPSKGSLANLFFKLYKQVVVTSLKKEGTDLEISNRKEQGSQAGGIRGSVYSESHAQETI